MKSFPGGTWITLEGKTKKEGANLVAIGYKYNYKKVLCFIMTKGSGSTRPGKPYIAKYPDCYGNVCTRHVARPQVISEYFKYSNVIDVHNQSRQYDLSLETKWVTHDGYFRLFTTLLGIQVVDCWKLQRGEDMDTIQEFADVLARELMVHNDDTDDIIEEDGDCMPPRRISTSTTITNPSSLSSDKEKQHTMERTTTQMRCLWCSRVNLLHRKTFLKCRECQKGFCSNGCWSHHVAFGGVPQAPTRGTKKRKVKCDEGL